MPLHLELDIVRAHKVTARSQQMLRGCCLQEPQAVEESSLPLLLPETADFKPTGQPDSPLANITDWVHYTDPQTGTTPDVCGSSHQHHAQDDPL